MHKAWLRKSSKQVIIIITFFLIIIIELISQLVITF